MFGLLFNMMNIYLIYWHLLWTKHHNIKAPEGEVGYEHQTAFNPRRPCPKHLKKIVKLSQSIDSKRTEEVLCH